MRPEPSESVPSGFDAAATRFDADERGNRVLAEMRERTFEQLRFAFCRGAKLVELGAGTGTDAARLVADHGCRVALVDVAPRMLERATDKVRAARPNGLIGAHRLAARSTGSLTAVYGCGSFDGAYSNFGALNCEPSLRPVADGLAELVRPGGAVVLSIINRWCPAETAWFALHGEWRNACRRWGGPVQAAAFPGGPKDVTTWYYSKRDIEKAFDGSFRLEHVEALPLLWPPPYLDFLVNRFERLFGEMETIEREFARWPLLRELGDHLLVRMRRR
jgi:SAM-dependent methyltransferase